MECAKKKEEEKSGCVKGSEDSAAVFSLTKEAERSWAWRGGSKAPECPPPSTLKSSKSASALFANDLWTEEDEWEGSLWDILKGEGRRGMNETDKSRPEKYSVPK